MYKVLRSFLFLFDPEKIHYLSMNALKVLCSVGFIKKMIAKKFQPAGHNQFSTLPAGRHVLNIPFKNKVGLGAGFDKNAKYLNELEALGFGFVEIGTVTPLAQDGNNRPRLFRLPADKALINRMGFNNDGVITITKRLENWKESCELRVKNYGLNNPQPLTQNSLLVAT